MEDGKNLTPSQQQISALTDCFGLLLNLLSLSGHIDAELMARHLTKLNQNQDAGEHYSALVQILLSYLPAQNDGHSSPE